MISALLKIYLLTLQISLVSFGGIYSFWAILGHEARVECGADGLAKQGPLSVCREDFDTVFGLSEVLPGPQVNVAAIVGYKMHGFPGMLVFVLGLLTPGLLITPLLFHYYQKFRFKRPLVLFLNGTGIATIAVLLVFLVRILRGAFSGVNPHSLGAMLLFLAVFYITYRFKQNPMIVVLSGGLFGFFFLQ